MSQYPTQAQPREHVAPPRAAEPVPRRLGTRVLGWSVMTLSLGLVSCQSLFVL
jgi:hypothetical protein